VWRCYSTMNTEARGTIQLTRWRAPNGNAMLCSYWSAHSNQNGYQQIWRMPYCDQWSFSVVCQSVMWLCCAKTAERIGVLFGVETLGGPMHFILDGGLDPCTANGPVTGGNLGREHKHRKYNARLVRTWRKRSCSPYGNFDTSSAAIARRSSAVTRLQTSHDIICPSCTCGIVGATANFLGHIECMRCCLLRSTFLSRSMVVLSAERTSTTVDCRSCYMLTCTGSMWQIEFGTSSPSQSTSVSTTRHQSTWQSVVSLSQISLVVSDCAQHTIASWMYRAIHEQHLAIGRSLSLYQPSGIRFQRSLEKRLKTLSGCHWKRRLSD